MHVRGVVRWRILFSVLKWTLHQSLRPGDIGYLTYLHGTIYEQEYGYDITFEAYIGACLADFAHTFKPDKDRIWFAKRNNRIVGSISSPLTTRPTPIDARTEFCDSSRS